MLRPLNDHIYQGGSVKDTEKSTETAVTRLNNQESITPAADSSIRLKSVVKTSPKKNLFSTTFKGRHAIGAIGSTFHLGQALSARSTNSVADQQVGSVPQEATLSNSVAITTKKRKQESHIVEQNKKAYPEHTLVQQNPQFNAPSNNAEIKSAFKPGSHFTKDQHKVLKLRNALFTMNNRLEQQVNTVSELFIKAEESGRTDANLAAQLEQQRASMVTPFVRAMNDSSHLSEHAISLATFAQKSAKLKSYTKTKNWSQAAAQEYLEELRQIRSTVKGLFPIIDLKQNNQKVPQQVSSLLPGIGVAKTGLSKK